MNYITSVKEKENIDTAKNDKMVKLPWVPKIGPKLREEFKIFSIKTIFTSGRYLKNLICKNKSFYFLIAFQVFTNYTALAMPYTLAKLKRKLSLEQ